MTEPEKKANKKDNGEDVKNENEETVRVGTVWDARSADDEDDDTSSEEYETGDNK